MPAPYFYALYRYTVGVPQVHHFGQEGLHNVLAIDLLGPNLEDLFDMCGRKFSIKTVCMAAKQMVSPRAINSFTPGIPVLFLSFRPRIRFLEFNRSMTSPSYTATSNPTIFLSGSRARRMPISSI